MLLLSFSETALKKRKDWRQTHERKRKEEPSPSHAEAKSLTFLSVLLNGKSERRKGWPAKAQENGKGRKTSFPHKSVSNFFFIQTTKLVRLFFFTSNETDQVWSSTLEEEGCTSLFTSLPQNNPQQKAAARKYKSLKLYFQQGRRALPFQVSPHRKQSRPASKQKKRTFRSFGLKRKVEVTNLRCLSFVSNEPYQTAVSFHLWV